MTRRKAWRMYAVLDLSGQYYPYIGDLHETEAAAMAYLDRMEHWASTALSHGRFRVMPVEIKPITIKKPSGARDRGKTDKPNDKPNRSKLKN